jgi:hypothetical protein
MKVRQLRNVLAQWQEFLHDRGLKNECRAVALFDKLLDGREDSTVAGFASGLAKAEWLGGSDDAPTMDAVLPHLNVLIELYEQGGASRQASQLRSLVGVVSGCPRQPMDAAFSLAGPRRARSRGADPTLVSKYVQRLQFATSNEDEFDATIAQLHEDRKVTKAVLTKIVNAFSEHEGSFKNKREALEWLRSARVEQVRFENKLTAGQQK